MVEFHANDSVSNAAQFKSIDQSHSLNFLSAIEDGMKGGLKGLGADTTGGFKNSDQFDSSKFSNREIQIAEGAKHLPKMEISDMKGFLSGTLQSDKTTVQKAANLIDETNTLGTDDQKKQLTKMFEDEYKKAADVARQLGGDEEAAEKAGEKAVRGLVDRINEELKNRNSDSRVSLAPPQSELGRIRYPGQPEEIGKVVVTRDGDQTDHITLYEPGSSPHRNAVFQFKSNLDGVTLETKK